MEGCGSNHYSESEFNALFSHIIDGDYAEYITSWFDPNTANALLKGISLDPNHPELGTKSIEEILDFLDGFDTDVVSESDVTPGFTPNYASDEDTTPLSSYAEVVESGGTRNDYDNIVNEFKTQIVERALLKDGKLINPEDVNSNLYQYKLELLKHIYEYVAPGKTLPNFDSDEEFTRFVKRTLAQFSDKTKTDDPKNFENYRSAFVTLQHFDDFLSDEIDFISIKPEFVKTGTFGKDMYISTGPFNYHDKYSSWSEEAGTEDYTSSFVKLLLWYFKYDGKPIGLDGFQAVSGKMIEWIEDSGNLQLQEALYLGLDDSVNPQKHQKGISFLFNEFAKARGFTSTIKGLANAIHQNIFSENSPLENKIKQIFINQFTTSVRYAYLAYRMKYDFSAEEVGPDAMRFTSDLLQSELINKQVYSIQRTIKNRVYALRSNPKLLEELKEKYGISIEATKITINKNGSSKVKPYTNSAFDSSEYVLNVSRDSDTNTYKFSSAAGNPSSNFISTQFVKSIIEDVTGLVLPADFIEVWNTGNPSKAGKMWDSFVRIVAITLTASERVEDNTGKLANLYSGYEYLYRGDELKLYNYYRDFEPLGNFYSIVYGSEYSTVIKNAEGNNLPTSQLRTSVFDVKHELYNLIRNKFSQRSNIRVFDQNTKTWIDSPIGKNVFALNVLKRNPTVLGTIAMRSDTKINDTSKIATELLPAEVMQEAIGVDFYHSLFGHNELSRNRIARQEREATDVSIWLQPIVYSDKRTHFVVEFKVDKINVTTSKGTKSLAAVLKNIAGFNADRNIDIQGLEQLIRTTRKDKYETQVLNLISRFSTALGWGLNRNEGESIIDYFARAKNLLHEEFVRHGKGTEAFINSQFGTSADIYVSDYSVADTGELFFNPTLDNQLKVNSDKVLFEKRMKTQKINFIRDLIDIGFMFDPANNPNWRSEFKKLQPKNPTWFDGYDGSMKLFKALDSDGNEIEIDWTNVNEINWNEVEFELNPILESYFYADSFLSNQFSDLLFGDVNGYKAKHSDYKLKDNTSLLNDFFYIEDESARLTDMAKRTVMAGASRITFAQGLKYGIDSKAKIAIIKDIPAEVFNFMGSQKKVDSHDGSTFVLPIFAREQNVSLLDRQGGLQKKKTFGNGLDPETGTAWELKHAEYTITNEFRRNGEFTEFSFELLYKKMSNIISDKIKNLDLSKYYGKTRRLNEQGDNIVCTRDVFKLNTNTFLHDKLVSIRKEGNETICTWQSYNDDGTAIPGTEFEERRNIQTLYDIDQLLGGAWCEVWDSDLNKFVFSEINQDILATVVAEENLKDCFIALAANQSAMKTGARNVNLKNPAVYGNNDPLKYFEISTLHYGIQMNPDHDLEDSHGVREMSQMISALIQSGYLTGDVNEIYQMIGDVALDAVRATINAVESEDQDAIYRIIGEALVKAFDTNQKSVLGLAQSFVAMANRDLANGSFKTRIPFSANTIKGSFQATITSFLNKDAIRRRYAGLGGIQTPSFGGVMYFPYKGKRMTWLEFMKAVGGERNAKIAMTDLSWNGVQFNNPTIIPIKNRLSLGLNDTVVYRDAIGNPIVVKLSTPDLLYQYKYDFDPNVQLYNWTVKPRNLAGSEIQFKANGVTFSIYDTDLVRIINELPILNKKPESFYTLDESNQYILTTRGTKLFNLLRNAFNEYNLTLDVFSDKDLQSQLHALAKWKVTNELLPRLSRIQAGQEFGIPVQESMKSEQSVEDWTFDNQIVLISDVKVSALQVGIGKLSAKKMGLEDGDSLNDVQTRGADFFKDKLIKKTRKPSTVDNDLYDVVLHGNDGSQTLVMVGGLSANSQRLNSTQSSTRYKSLGNEYWKNGESFGSTKGKYFREYIDYDGKSYDVVIVDSWNDFEDLYNSGHYSNYVYNYTEDNWKTLVRHAYRHNFNNDILQTSIGKNPETNRDIIEQLPDGDLIAVEPNRIINQLNGRESNRQKQFVNKRAEEMFEAFNLQLKLIIDRIPSQSMQSFTSADVVMLLDTKENALVMSAFLAWLQGSDYDVDKGFIMTYEISDDGRIITPSKLNRYYKASEVLDLPLPNRRRFEFSTFSNFKAGEHGSETFTFIDLEDIANGIGIDVISRILNGPTQVVFADEFDTDKYRPIKKRIEDRIRLHQSSIDLPTSVKTAGYRNKIVHKIHKMLRNPIVQANMNLPVDDAMDEIKKSIPTPEFKSEFFRTWDNPAAKFRLQYDNMVGRAVIGISAVSLKAFFAETAYGNNVINKIQSLVNSYKATLSQTGQPDAEIGTQIIKELQKICFDAKFIKDSNIKTNIATISNLRFADLRSSLHGLNIVFNEGTNLNTSRLTQLQRYKLNGQNVLNLSDLISDLDIYANGNFINPKDAYMVLSGYTSLATDNAKELALSKMNATSKFADFHTYLTTIGIRPKDIIGFMASPAFNIIKRYSESSVLDPNTSRFNVENALDFILDRKTLTNIDDYMFKSILTSTVNEKSLFDKNIGLSVSQLLFIAKELPSPNNIRLTEQDEPEIRKVINDATLDESSRDKLVTAIYKLFIIDPSAEQTLLRVLRNGIEKTTDSKTEDLDPELLYEQQFSVDDYIDESDYEEDAFYSTKKYHESWELGKRDWIYAYSYVKNYLIPKNKALRKLNVNYQELYKNLESILRATKEQQMLGSILGINQGMSTSDYDEYNNVKKIEKYINKKYYEYTQANPKAELEKFDLIRFLGDETYRNNQIEQYSLVAETYNILDLVTSVPHFNAMLKLLRYNRYLIRRSVALEMERDLAERLITADKETNNSGFGYGDTQSLNPKEWSALRNYVNDLIILKWFEQQPNLTIGTPVGSIIYDKGQLTKNSKTDPDGKETQVVKSVSLNTLDGLATFKRLMDIEIIPALKRIFKENEFVQDIIVGNIHNNPLERLQTFYRPSFDISEASKNPSLGLKYQTLSAAFNKIMKQYLPEELASKYGRWKIGDLFFLYNLYVHKDGFSSQAFTRFFEDSNTSSDKFVYSKQFYDYLSKLDSREVDYKTIFKDEISPNLTVKSDKQNDYLIDLRVRMANFANSSYRFKIEANGSGTGYNIIVYDKDNQERKVPFWNPDLNPSDYTLWFPYKVWKNGEQKTQPRVDKRLSIKTDSILDDITIEGVSREVIATMVDRLQELTNYKIPIKIVNEAELKEMYERGEGEIKFMDENDYLRTSSARAFIYNGTVYINQKASIDDPIHEFLHIVMASMKFNPDPRIKARFYDWLNWAITTDDGPARYNRLQLEYGNRRDSDIKEEVLVERLSNVFATTFESDWLKLNEQSTEALKESDLTSFVINSLNALFGSDIPLDIDPLALGNTDIRTILSMFGTTLAGMNKTDIATMILPNNQRLREIKMKLLNSTDDNNKITFGKDCI